MIHIAKGTTINLPYLASALGAAKGAGFDTDKILAQIVAVFLGGSAAQIPAQLIQELADIITNFSKDPAGTMIDTALGAVIPLGMAKGVGMILDMLGLPKRRKFGKITIVWGI